MAIAFDRLSFHGPHARIAPFYNPSRHSAPFHVSVREPASVEYWCRHFNTTPERLLDAVKRVGSNPDIIRLELRSR